jgi:hypothetical protein
MFSVSFYLNFLARKDTIKTAEDAKLSKRFLQNTAPESSKK